LIVNHVVVRYLYSHEKIERFVEGDEDVLIEEVKFILTNAP
jgi:hypothetical protein